ncbi:MAG: hypothetical protein GXX84_01500 [Acidobacteria bacterium]|nr:hypothetical protein [Acidobacteriota bacterium]
MQRRANFRILFITLLFFSAFSIGMSQEVQKSEQEHTFRAVVPEGTVIPIVLTAYLNSRSSQPGDRLYADTTYPIWIAQKLVIPKGSTIRGTVTAVKRPGRIKGKGQIAVRFDDILLPNGVMRNLVATFRGIHGPGEETVDRSKESVESGSSTGTDAGTVVGTAGTGAVIGVLAGNAKGAGIGAGVGAAAGLAAVLFSRGRDLVLSPGTQFDLELMSELKFDYNELDFSQSQLENAQRNIRMTPRPPQEVRPPTTIPGVGLPRPF